MPLLWYRDSADGALKPYAMLGDHLEFGSANYSVTTTTTAVSKAFGAPSNLLGQNLTAFGTGLWTCPRSGVWQLVLSVRTTTTAILAGIIQGSTGYAISNAAKPGVGGIDTGTQAILVADMTQGDVFNLSARSEPVCLVNAQLTATKLRTFDPATGSGLPEDYVSLAGDTMLGPLILAADPAVALEASTKQYTDSKVVNSYGQSSTTRAPSQAAVEGAINALNNKQIGAGGGLTGTGTIASGPVLAVGAGTGITVTADTVAVNTSVIATVASMNTALAGKVDDNAYTQVGVRCGTFNLGAIAAGASAGPFTVAHGMGRVPDAVTVSATDDTGVQSIVMSITSWDGTNIVFLARNVGGGTETARGSWIAVG